MKHDEFGDRMKAYEKAFTSEVIDPKKWMAVRIDGRGFSKFTKGFVKPFDTVITNTMIATMEGLVKETHATIGHTQSDEITLLFAPTENERIFGGKVSKINSVFASIATAIFNRTLGYAFELEFPKLAYFDCRVWEVPSDIEASNVLLWRVNDARKNSVSAYFRWTVGHSAMQNLNVEQMREVLSKSTAPWETLPNRWKYGTYVKPTTVVETISDSVLAKIPDGKKPLDGKVTRTKLVKPEIEYFGDYPLDFRVNFIK